MYNKESNKDFNCLMVQVDLRVHCVHIFCISSNFSGGIDMVLVMVLTSIPKQVTCVSDGISLLLSAKPDLAREITETGVFLKVILYRSDH